jgi:hypothetical protein
MNLAAEGANTSGVASLEEGFALWNRPSIVVAEVDLVTTLPVVTAFTLCLEVFRLRASVLRRHKTDDTLGAAADLPRVTLAVPVAAVLKGLPVLIPCPLVHA